MPLKTMNPDTIRELISQHQDILTPAAKAEEDLYRNAKCPVCFSQECTKKIDPPKVVMGPDGPVVVSSPFTSGVLVNGHAVCSVCHTEFDPRSGIIRKSVRTLDPPQGLP